MNLTELGNQLIDQQNIDSSVVVPLKTNHSLESIESPKKRLKLDTSLVSRPETTDTPISTRKSGLMGLSGENSTPKESTFFGSQLLYTKLSIEAKSLCSVLPTANKVVTTRNWRV